MDTSSKSKSPQIPSSLLSLMTSKIMSSILMILVLFTVTLQLVSGIPSLDRTSNEPLFAVVGEDALIDCRAEKLENYTILWRFLDATKKDDDAGEVLSAGPLRIVSDTRFEVLHRPDSEIWVLKIKNVKVSDTGMYICEVNSVPKIRNTRLLTVAEDGESTGLPAVFNDVDHNYTDCCMEERVPSACLSFCHFKGLIGDGPPPAVIQSCIHHLSSITKCLADGRNHMPCCQKQNIPHVCRPVCIGNFSLSTVLDHFTCMHYTAPVLACIADGVQTLPPQPKDVTVDAVSPTELFLSWKLPIRSADLIENFQINVTQLHSFDGFGVRRLDGSSSISADDDPPLYGLQMRFSLMGNETSHTIKDLKPYTMYEIQMLSTNKIGSSIPISPIRTLTLQPEEKSAEPTKPPKTKDQPKLPDMKKCCKDNGVGLDRCIEILCDPVKTDEASLTDLMICAPWANVTFKCVANGVDHSGCCQQRGVSVGCLDFCRGDLKKLDFRHFVCLDQMPAYSSCILDHHGVLPSAPVNFMVVNVHHDWAIIKWQPPKKLSNTVKKYHVFWREIKSGTSRDDLSLRYQVKEASKSPFLLDGLNPGGRYEVYVKATNSYGTSQGSSRVVFSTPPIYPNEEIEMLEVAVGYNETQCCARASLSSDCLPLCSYRVKVMDVLHRGASCAQSLPTLVRCAAGGRNHIPCCRRRGVVEGCLNLCAGLVETSPYVAAARCADDLGKMLQCMEEGTGLLPGMPLDFHASLVTKDTIHLEWQPAPEDMNSTLNYQVRFGQADSDIPLHPLEHDMSLNVSKPNAILTNLNPGIRYSLYVVASNMYGISLPSLVLVVNTSQEADARTTMIQSSLGPPHSLQVLHQSVDTITFKWLPPLYVPPDSNIMYTVHYKPVNGTATETSGNKEWTKIETSYNTMYLTNLTYNTEYALAVQAKTTHLKSSLSEVVLVWTDPAIPASVNLPVIIPAGPIVEDSNVTFMCIGVGIPTPIISMLINGQVVMREERRHISLTIIGVKRNLTSVSCYASNGFGRDAQSAQSSLEIRVRFKPVATAHDIKTTAVNGGPTRLQCEFAGNPQPHVLWYKEMPKNGGHVQLGNGPNIAIVTVPHSEITSTWVNSLVFKQVSPDDAANYSCSVVNELGQDAATLSLTVDASSNYSFNARECCKRQSVVSECQKVCGFDIDVDQALQIPECYPEIDKLMACAADGSDHRQCCRRKGVPSDCIRWCAGLKVNRPSLCAVSSAADIISCFQEGKALLPGPPQEVHVKRFMEDNRVIVEWEPPKKNPELVQWYRVFWRPVGSRDLNRNQTDKPYFELEGLDSQKMYEFVVKSGNHYGLSVFTDPLVISMHAARTTSIGNHMLNILLGISVTAVFLILMGGMALYAYRNYNFPKILRRGVASSSNPSAISFENPSYMKDAPNGNSVPTVQFQPPSNVEVNANYQKSSNGHQG